jgi:hypothetical protein
MSYDISMGRELGAMIYQWVGIRSYDISMSWELGDTINIKG